LACACSWLIGWLLQQREESCAGGKLARRRIGPASLAEILGDGPSEVPGPPAQIRGTGL